MVNYNNMRFHKIISLVLKNTTIKFSLDKYFILKKISINLYIPQGGVIYIHKPQQRQVSIDHNLGKNLLLE